MPSETSAQRTRVPDFDEVREARLALCLERSLQAFQACGVADEADCARLRRHFTEATRAGQPADLVELLARLKGTEEEHMGAEVARIAHQLSLVISPSPPLIPFAGRLMAPSAFYESFGQLHALGRSLLAPVIYAEDTDAIGTGALNPIAALLMAEEIHLHVHRRFAVRPFVTSVRLDYDSWCFLTRKHFEL